MAKTGVGTKNRILTSAKKLFILHGYRGTSTKRLAEDAGISEMTLFRHFGSKEEVYRMVIQPVVDFLGSLDIQKDGSANEVVVEAIKNRISFLCEERDLVRLVLMESYVSSTGFNPIAETADRIRGTFSDMDTERADLYMRLVMGFILSYIFLPAECDQFQEDLSQLMDLL